MGITIEIKPDLALHIEQAAARAGLAVDEFVTRAIAERLNHPNDYATTEHDVAEKEAHLLQQINRGLTADEWQRYRALIAKRQAETLSDAEQRELVETSNRIEGLNAARITHLIELAHLRRITLEAVMKQLGIPATSYA